MAEEEGKDAEPQDEPGERLRSKGCCHVWSGGSQLGTGLFSGAAGANMSARPACLPYSISWRGWQESTASAGEEREAREW